MSFVVPGDPIAALLGPEATPEEYDELREVYGLNDPVPVQYGRWLVKVIQGDLGTSIKLKQPVGKILIERLGRTIVLSGSAIVIAIVIGLPAGLIAAAYPRSLLDRILTIGTLFGNSMPIFWMGLMLILIFSVSLGWFPTGGMSSILGGGLIDRLHHLFLPALTLSSASLALIARITRASMLDVIGQDYMSVAYSKGIGQRLVLLRHGLPNAALPVITVIALQTGKLLGGAVVTETVFAWPGIGSQMYAAISTRDIPLIQGGVLLIAVLFLLSNLLADLLYLWVDPRVR
jgi:peptide/nickel transport system permease protein